LWQLLTVDGCVLDIGSSDLDEDANTNRESIDDSMMARDLLMLGAAL